MNIPMTPRPGLREVTRNAVRTAISSAAMSMFAEQGFEETTVDQIAAAVGMSSRSVFRYFATKEDIIVGDLMDMGKQLAIALELRPRSEAPWTALRRALDDPLDAVRRDHAETLARCTMMASTPSLRAAQQRKHSGWRSLLTPIIADRLDPGIDAVERNLQADAIVSAILACLDVAVSEWTRSRGARPMDELLDMAIEAVRA